MNILLLTHRFWPDVGGIESISQMMAEQFTEEGHKVTVVTWSEDPIGFLFLYDVIRKPGMATLIKYHRLADVVFENNICLRLSWPSVLFFKRKIIVLQTWISDENSNNKLQGWIKNKWLKSAHIVVACSEAIRIGCWPKAEVIGNPYQQRLFKILPEIERNQDFVFVGRLVSDKGADLAIRSIEKILKNTTYSNIVFNIIGDGPEKENLQKIIDEAKLHNNVRLLGTLRGDALVKCLNKHRFIIVPSKWEEPFGIVALEGMACGCLPIVSDRGGLPDAIGTSGLTFKAGDCDSLVDTMLDILRNKPLEIKLRTSAIKHLEKNSSTEISRKYLSLMQSIF